MYENKFTLKKLFIVYYRVDNLYSFSNLKSPLTTIQKSNFSTDNAVKRPLEYITKQGKL